MVTANVAIKLEEPVLLDIDGNEVASDDLAFGLPTKYKVTKPQYCLFVDETGKNTN